MSKNKKEVNKSIDHFFVEYETNFNEAISGNKSGFRDNIKAAFADCFIESSPVGVVCGKNDDQFIKRIEQGFDFYKSIGSKSMHILSKDLTYLDDYHTMAKIRWHYTALKEDNQEVSIDFDIFYILSSINDEVKIVAYIAGDEQKALKESGLLERSNVLK